MAKKKNSEEVSVDVDIMKEITSKYGNVFVPVEQIKNDAKITLPVSPNLDVGLNGGIPEGSWVIISGPPKSGKTTLSLHIAAKRQKEEYGGKNVYYLDVEGRLKEMNIAGCRDLIQTKPRFNIIGPTEGNILDAEQYVNIGIDIIKRDPGCVLILDSASALCSSKEYEDDVTGQTRALGPKILASFCRKLAGIVPVNKSIVIIMQHMIANTSGYGSPYIEDGGRKLQYQSDIKLRFKSAKHWDNNLGQTANIEVVYSALGPPGLNVSMHLRYNYGIDELSEIIDNAISLGIITKGGAWFTFKVGENYEKIQGEEKVWEFFNENKEAAKELEEQVRGMLS